MSLLHALRLGSVLAVLALVAGSASAQHHGGGHAGGHVGGAHIGGPHPGAHYVGGARPHYTVPHYSGYRGGVFIGIGSGLGYGYGSGLGYGNLGYGYGGYGYSGGYGYGNYGYSSLGVPAIPGTYYAPSYSALPSQPLSSQPLDTQPLPLPVPNATGEAAPATITVIASDGATVTFDGIDTNQTGTRHSFTTRPIDPGIEKRVSVKVDGPGGPATISIGVRAGEKATVDMRK